MRKEGNVLFNDALNTFYLWLYGVGHMVKDNSDSERGNPLPSLHLCELLFSISSKGSFICTILHTDSTYHGCWYTSRGALAGMRNSSMSEHAYHELTSLVMLNLSVKYIFHLKTRKEGNILFTVIWHQTYGKGSFR